MKVFFYYIIQKLVDSKFFLIYLSRWKSVGWISKYSKAAPFLFKKKLFDKNDISDGIWVETGTYIGLSTEYLADISKMVYSIEPSNKYYELSKEKLSSKKNVKLFHGTSEDCLGNLLENIDATNISFWLDGHFSAGDTFEGLNHSPVLHELDLIKNNLLKFEKINILIDDFRIFSSFYPKANKHILPNQMELINWANENNFHWKVQKNIMILSR